MEKLRTMWLVLTNKRYILLTPGYAAAALDDKDFDSDCDCLFHDTARELVSRKE
jgi:hypothetical protein